jgi:hypothetical protein
MSEQDDLIDYLISAGEAVEYGEPWTETTTHEWWRDTDGVRQVRLVQTYHGGGNRGDDDEAEYVQRLLDMGRASFADFEGDITDAERDFLPPEITHVIRQRDDGSLYATRIRYYMPPPEGVTR